MAKGPSKRRVRDAIMRPLDLRIARVEDRLIRTQALVARTLQATQRLEAVVSEVRKQPEYERAYVPEPLVSIRVATYNRAKLLCERALSSIQRQTYERWEAIVVGDGCSDDTEDRVRALGDPRIRFQNLPFNGPYPEHPRDRWLVNGYRAVNTAIQLAAGSWIAAVDDDDELAPDHVERLLRFAQDERAEVAYGMLAVFDEQLGRRTERTVGVFPPRANEFAFQAAMVHAGFREFRFDPYAYLTDVPEDWLLAQQMWDAGLRFAFLDEVVGTYYYRPPPPR